MMDHHYTLTGVQSVKRGGKKKAIHTKKRKEIGWTEHERCDASGIEILLHA